MPNSANRNHTDTGFIDSVFSYKMRHPLRVSSTAGKRPSWPSRLHPVGSPWLEVSQEQCTRAHTRPGCLGGGSGPRGKAMRFANLFPGRFHSQARHRHRDEPTSHDLILLALPKQRRGGDSLVGGMGGCSRKGWPYLELL